MKIFRNITLLILILLVAAIVFKNPLIKWAVTAGASQVTGAPVRIDSLAVGILKPAVRIKGFKVYNPKGFPRGVLLNIEELSVNYDLPAILKGHLHLPLLVVHLQEAVIVKNTDGVLNVDALKFAQKPPESSSGKSAKSPTGKSGATTKPMAMRIDVMKLDLGQVVFKDYTRGPEPVVTAIDARIHGKVYKNITSAQQLATIITVEALGPTAIKSAGIYAAATVLGAGFLPVGIAGVLIGKDSGTADFKADLAKVYQAALTAVRKRGKVEQENQAKGVIKAAIDGASVVVEMTAVEGGKVRVKVAARKLMIPKPEIAQGILYEIGTLLK